MYSTSEQFFLEFCRQCDCQLLPGSDITLNYYTASRTQRLQLASVRVYMSVVRSLHLEMGLSYSEQQPSLLSRGMKGIARSGATHRTRLPITTPLLRARLDGMQFRVPHNKAMITAAFFLAFHGFLRCGELTSLMKWEDIKIDMARHCLEVRLQRSKAYPDACALYSRFLARAHAG